MELDNKIHYISTILYVKSKNGLSQGTGFFYSVIDQTTRINETLVEHRIVSLHLITNKHVLLGKYNSQEIPDTLIFRIKFFNQNSGKITVENVEIDRNTIIDSTKLHKKNEVDIVSIDITNIMSNHLDKNPDLMWSAISKDDFPTKDSNIEITDSIITIGYPKGFYDEFNQFPIVKSGIISSKWNANFNDNNFFLIDSKLFPGSSGSLVITKPSHLYNKGGKLVHSTIKKFEFIGVYSGQYEFSNPINFDGKLIPMSESYNLGIVWYYYLVDEIIEKGILLKKIC